MSKTTNKSTSTKNVQQTNKPRIMNMVRTIRAADTRRMTVVEVAA